MAISRAMLMQCTGCGEPLLSILERAMEVCGACDFSRRYRAGLLANTPVVGGGPMDLTRSEQTAEKARYRGETP
jgi:hypothetical protein